jgi:hypothetical protein
MQLRNPGGRIHTRKLNFSCRKEEAFYGERNEVELLLQTILRKELPVSLVWREI